jgi:acyl carrier protein
MTNSLFASVQRIAADLFNIPADKVLPQSSPATIENWDSLHHLNLVLGLESEFRVQFSPEEIARMQTVQNIVSLVEKKLSRPAL